MIGILVGSIAALVYYIASLIFTIEIAIVLSMVCSVLTTGAFHEDGLADSCDGFGGGWTKDKILLIMKDSRLGTFGVIGLFAILVLKFSALQDLATSAINIPLLIIAGHAISRFIATILLYTHTYVRDIESSKIKPTTTQMSTKSLIISFGFGILPLFFFQDYWVFLSLIPLIVPIVLPQS